VPRDGGLVRQGRSHVQRFVRQLGCQRQRCLDGELIAGERHRQHRLDELVARLPRLNSVVLQPRPRLEACFARDHELRLRKLELDRSAYELPRDTLLCVAVVRPERPEQVLGRACVVDPGSDG
jgi:hypothetical protein